MGTIHTKCLETTVKITIFSPIAVLYIIAVTRSARFSQLLAYSQYPLLWITAKVATAIASSLRRARALHYLDQGAAAGL